MSGNSSSNNANEKESDGVNDALASSSIDDDVVHRAEEAAKLAQQMEAEESSLRYVVL